MMARVSGSVLTKFFNMQIQRQDEVVELEAAAEARHQAELGQSIARHIGEEDESSAQQLLARAQDALGAPTQPRPATQRSAQRIGRNDPCPCGSGKKFKHCHGAVDEDSADV
jgi:preprotein translocase subunit SecA